MNVASWRITQPGELQTACGLETHALHWRTYDATMPAACEKLQVGTEHRDGQERVKQLRGESLGGR